MKNFLQIQRITPMMLAVAAVALSGCAATREAENNFSTERVKTQAVHAGGQVKSSVGMTSATDPKSNFGHATKNWVNPVPLPKIEVGQDRARLPALFKRNVSLTMPGRVSLVEIVSELQRVQGVRFDISPDVYSAAAGGGQGRIINPNGGGGGSSADETPVIVNDFVFRGTLENALDLMAAKSNTSWQWTGSGVKVFRYETKSYSIAALAGILKTNSSVSMLGADNSGSGAGGTSAAQTNQMQGVNRTTDLTRWDEIRTYLLSLMSPKGTLAVMESAGLITVNDTPAAHASIKRSLKELNAVISQQIFVNVDVYAVTRNNADNMGLDWSLAWGTANSRYGVGYSNTGNTADKGNFNIGVMSGPFQGSSVMLNALSTLGKASVVNQFALTTLNGEPTPVSSNRKIGFVESIETEEGTDGRAPTIKVKQSAVYAGINLTVTPKIQPDGKILMEYGLNLNDVEEIKNFTTGSGANSQTIQLPTTTVKSILQRASLKSGQTLVLSGFKQTATKVNNSGTGHAKNMVLGGLNNASNEEQYLVITITPYVAQESEL